MQNSVWATQTHYRPPRVVIYKHGQGRHTPWYSASTRDVGHSASIYLITLLGSFLYDKKKIENVSQQMCSPHIVVFALGGLFLQKICCPDGAVYGHTCMCLFLRNKEKLEPRKTTLLK